MNKYLISTRNASFLYDLATDTYKEIKLDNHPLTLYSGCRDGDKLIVCTRDRMIESLKFQDDSLVRNFQGIKLPKFGIVPFPIGDNKYYVGTKGNGLVLVDFRNGTVERLQTGDKHWLEIFSLCHDDDGKLWIGSSDGVIIMDRDRSIRRYEPGVMPDNNIRSLFKDSSGGIWIGTEYVGAMYWNKQRDKFKPYADDRFHMQDKIITTLNQDENGTFWVGTRNDGLYRFADGQKSVRHFPMDNIRTLYATKDGRSPGTPRNRHRKRKNQKAAQPIGHHVHHSGRQRKTLARNPDRSIPVRHRNRHSSQNGLEALRSGKADANPFPFHGQRQEPVDRSQGKPLQIHYH